MKPSGKDIVRQGYDQIADTHLAIRRVDATDAALLRDFADRLPKGGSVLDAGCGSGIPAARYLGVERGFDVVGVDFSEAQVALARSIVPMARFVQADLTSLTATEFPDESLDGICSFYAIIHIPRLEHQGLLGNFLRMLRPGGLLLFSTGYSASDDDIEDDWFGTRMYWSHFDREVNLKMVQDCGFELVWERVVIESEEFGGGTHLFVLARKPAS